MRFLKKGVLKNYENLKKPILDIQRLGVASFTQLIKTTLTHILNNVIQDPTIEV